MDWLRASLKSKTMWAGIASVITGLAELFTEAPAEATIGSLVAGVALIVLRVITKEPLKDKVK